MRAPPLSVYSLPITIHIFGFAFLFGGADLMTASHLLSTFFTQATLFVTRVATPFEELVLTLPVSVTTPALVATSMASPLSEGVAASLALTLSVICASVVAEQSTGAGAAIAGFRFLFCAQTALVARNRDSTEIRNLFIIVLLLIWGDSNWEDNPGDRNQ